jgi:soluble lytic murein transglycosylase-like protein
VKWTKAQLMQIVIDAADSIGFPRQIALNQINQESRWNINACSHAGACGLAQFMPATAKRFGLTDRRDPVASMKAWAKYMSFLMRRYKGNIALALAAYNAGEGNVDKYKGIPPFKETRNYVRIIMNGQSVKANPVTSSLQVMSSLAVRPVQTMSDFLPTSTVGKIAVGLGVGGLTIAVTSKLLKS